MLTKAKAGAALALAALVLVPGGPAQGSSAQLRLAGLERPVRVIGDGFGIPHVYAETQNDVFRALGYLHARDRLFQMDVFRRQAGGTLATLLGAGRDDQVLKSDVALRTIGLRRAAQRSLNASPPEALALLEAYAGGVNAFLAASPLPPEYEALELTTIPAWTALDSLAVVKLIAFSLSFDDNELRNTELLLAYTTALGPAAGFALFSEDVMRSAPFDPAVSIEPGETSGDLTTRPGRSRGAPAIKTEPLAAASSLLEATAGIGLLAEPEAQGSNWWVVAGSRTSTGYPLLAGDPHLALTSPPIWYEVDLNVSGGPRDGMHVYGTSFAGTPLPPHGFTDHVMWSSTVNPLDVTDFFQEELVFSATGIPIATKHDGVAEPLTIVPETFQVNQPGNRTLNDVVTVSAGPRPGGAFVPPATFVVPRRNNGPLLAITGRTGISVAYTGFGPTQEIQAFLEVLRARNVREFGQALRFFDFGSQNWVAADVEGNIAYFTGAEAPIREDLQAGFVAGLPPWFVRDGTGAVPNEWIPDATPAPDQATPFEILGFDEMPHVVNPADGWIANANQDPIGVTLDNNPLNQLRAGGGIYYLAPGYAIGNRLGRIKTRIAAELAGGGTVSPQEMADIQADVVLRDAEALVPHITAAFAAAQTPGAPAQLAGLAADPAVAEGVGRLTAWDWSTPTGIDEGYDAADNAGVRGTPSAQEVASSVAATIYSLWRSRIIANTVDAKLSAIGLGSFLPSDDRALIAVRHLLDTFGTSGGVGASGIAFFNMPELSLSAAAERDVLILTSLKQALDRAAGSSFFGTASQASWQWGNLHRIVFGHILDGPFNIPPRTGSEQPSISTDGGFDVVDASGHDARASTPAQFMFGSGPSRRFVGEAQPSGVRATQVIAGGQSGNPLGAHFGDQLPLWLTNEAHPALARESEVAQNAASRELFLPG